MGFRVQWIQDTLNEIGFGFFEATYVKRKNILNTEHVALVLIIPCII